MQLDNSHSRLLDDDNAVERNESGSRKKAVTWHRYSTLLMGVLGVSIFINIILTLQYRRSTSLAESYAPSIYAGLQYNTKLPFEWETPYNGDDEALADKLWDELGAEVDVGLLAIPNTWALSKQLPEAQPFPWDVEKSIYLMNGHHNLHCLRLIRTAYFDYRRALNQSVPFAHINHCLDALRQDIICHADDTPRYTTTDTLPISGLGQQRQCRDWKKLQAWASERGSCYRKIEEGKAIREIERYKYCDVRSGHLPMVRKFFGLDEDWVPPADERRHTRV